MIDIESINPVALPSLPVALRKGLPICSSIYFVLEGNEVVYIGRSVNLNTRWSNHHRLCQLSENAAISWLEVSDCTLLDSIESVLIEYFCPKFNGTDVERSQADKTRVAAYISLELKESAEKMAQDQKRSLSNLIEVLLDDAVKKYKNKE